MLGRRRFLSAIPGGAFAGTALGSISGDGGGVGGTVEASTRVNHDGYPFRRDAERVRLVEADPEFGFDFPYQLATPETFRSEPVPLLFEMNNAAKGQEDIEELTDRVHDQITRFELQSPWLSEELGVPHLIPVVPRPDGDPVDSTHETISLDRQTMLHEGTTVERLDLQLLRMADHARQRVLSDRDTHARLLIYGNSSGGVVGERMAAMHPEEILAVAGGGLNGLVVLPFEELGGRTLNYPIGVADFEEILGKAYDPDAHDEVNMFYFQGGEDEENRLPMGGHGDPDVWVDLDMLLTARATYGRDMVSDRFPRCHLAYLKAGVAAQFRVYEGMTHNPEPASHDIREFYRRSIEGEDVSEFGQRLELPLDGEPEANDWRGVENGLAVEFGLSKAYPPPAGLVSYRWAFGDGSTGSGLPVSHTFEDPGTYEVTLTMETSHGQQVERTTEFTYEATPTATSTEASTANDSNSTDMSTESAADGPGFGAAGALAGLTSTVGYLLYQSKDEQ